MNVDAHGPITEDKSALARTLDAAGWGVFFVWIGICYLVSIGWGVSLLGVGLITLGGQVARRSFGLPLERFSLVIGAMFLLGGVWKVLELRVGATALPGGFVPILFIVAGLLLVVSALRRWPPHAPRVR